MTNKVEEIHVKSFYRSKKETQTNNIIVFKIQLSLVTIDKSVIYEAQVTAALFDNTTDEKVQPMKATSKIAMLPHIYLPKLG